MNSVITVIGNDAVGIIARVSGFLAKNDINIIDITQTTNDNQFLMVMVVDMSQAAISFFDAAAQLKVLGEEMGLKIHVRHKKVFDSMHRI